MKDFKCCSNCRHHHEDECRFNPVPVAVTSDYWCGHFSSPVAASIKAKAKFSDDQVLAIVRENWEPLAREDGEGFLPGMATPRTHVVEAMMESGVTQTPVLKRIEKLVRQGLLIQGNDPAGHNPGIHLWPAPTTPDLKPGATVALTEDGLIKAVAELTGTANKAMSLRAIHRAIGERPSLSAVHRMVRSLVESGRMQQTETGIWCFAPTSTQRAGITPTPPTQLTEEL